MTQLEGTLSTVVTLVLLTPHPVVAVDQSPWLKTTCVLSLVRHVKCSEIWCSIHCCDFVNLYVKYSNGLYMAMYCCMAVWQYIQWLVQLFDATH